MNLTNYIYGQVNVIFTITGVHVEWQSPSTQITIPSTSDAILATNTNNNNTAELDAMLAELDALLIPDVDPRNSTLQNTSLLLTELGTPSILANGNLLNSSESIDAGMANISVSTSSARISYTHISPNLYYFFIF